MPAANHRPLKTPRERREAILHAMRKGLESACEDAFLFSEDYSRELDAEYLLTVNVGKEVFRLNQYVLSPELRIRLEHATDDFAATCLPSMVRGPAKKLGGDWIMRGKPQFAGRAGKIDVTVTRKKLGQSEDTAVCAIELKGFNPSKPDVIKDLERNVGLFAIKGPTGTSQIEFTAFAALHSYNAYERQKQRKQLKKLKERYDGYCSAVSLPKGMLHKVRVFEIRTPMVIEAEPDIFELEGRFFAGAIVTYYRLT